MKTSSPVHLVMSDPRLVSRIVSFLRYDEMKICKGVNKLWKYEITKLTRPRTRVCVNEENLDAMLYASTILGLSLHIRWSNLISHDLRSLLQKCSRYINALSWFVDSSGQANPQQRKDECVGAGALQPLLDISFPNVTELYLILTQNEKGHLPNFGLIVALLNKCRKLESLRLEVFDAGLDFSLVLQEIKRVGFEHLASLRIGQGVQLKLHDFKLIKCLSPSLNSFTCECPLTLDSFSYQAIFQGAWMQSLFSLELQCPPPSTLPQMYNLRRLSIKALALTNYSLSLTNQFPNLEDLSFSLQPGYDWSAWIPFNMESHRAIKSLTYSSTSDLQQEDRACLQRLISKLPNLKSLACPVDDYFLQIICKTLPRLKTLKVHGSNCTDAGVTGISPHTLSEILNSCNVNTTRLKTVRNYREYPSIFDLKELQNLTLMHTGITDLSVRFTISGMKKLQTLYITGISMVGILELISSQLKLRELGVPQPIQKTVSFEDIFVLQRMTPHTKIVAGWDAPYI